MRKIKQADILFSQLLLEKRDTVVKATNQIVEALKGKTPSTQLLGLAATLICMLQKYELDHIDVLGLADSMVFGGMFNNMHPEFKSISKKFEEI